MFVDFSKAFDSIHSEMILQILLIYILLKENVTAKIMIYENKKAMIRTPDGDSDFFFILSLESCKEIQEHHVGLKSTAST